MRILERFRAAARVAEQAEQMQRPQQSWRTRKGSISLELHDRGTDLTALRMELGRIDRIRTLAEPRLAGAANVNSWTPVDRGSALGLRPSMLDDFGLRAALEWLARDVARAPESVSQNAWQSR
jgi:signal transduction histidine kinase